MGTIVAIVFPSVLADSSGRMEPPRRRNDSRAAAKCLLPKRISASTAAAPAGDSMAGIGKGRPGWGGPPDFATSAGPAAARTPGFMTEAAPSRGARLQDLRKSTISNQTSDHLLSCLLTMPAGWESSARLASPVADTPSPTLGHPLAQGKRTGAGSAPSAPSPRVGEAGEAGCGAARLWRGRAGCNDTLSPTLPARAGEGEGRAQARRRLQAVLRALPVTHPSSHSRGANTLPLRGEEGS